MCCVIEVATSTSGLPSVNTTQGNGISRGINIMSIIRAPLLYWWWVTIVNHWTSLLVHVAGKLDKQVVATKWGR